MTAALPKRLIEVDLPIKRISAHARREKSIRHGHISTLHIWWARRPLAACRAVLCASLWPDPADPLCPDEFRQIARLWMTRWSTSYLKSLGRESYERFVRFQNDPAKLDNNEELRHALLDFIADFANWDNAGAIEYLETSRALTQAAHKALGGSVGTRPLVVDPFAGGGSIPLEALRVGADAFASDLNPIPVLLNRVVLEYVPKFGHSLADEVRRWGEWIRKEAEKELASFYPTDPDGATPIAYLWARTINCEGPNCGAEVPLIRSLWLAKKPHRSVALQLLPNTRSKRIDIRVITKHVNKWVDSADPKVVFDNPKLEGTVKGGAATCPCCGYTTPVARVREQLRQRRGGARDATLICVVTTRTGQIGRSYRVATLVDSEVVKRAVIALAKLESESTAVPPIPNEPLPIKGTLGFRVQNYGILNWGDIYTARQALTLATIARLVREAGKRASGETSKEQGTTYQAILALCLSRLIGRVNALCWWRSQADQEKIEVAFSGQTVPMKWDFAEACPLTTGTAGWDDAYKPPIEVIDGLAGIKLHQGTVAQGDASSHPLPNDAADAFVTDPPYYDAVPYSALSDFFYVWFKRSLPPSVASAFSSSVAPKDQECIVDEASGKDRAYFERSMRQAMAEGRRILSPSGVGVVVFAHKSTSGWEAQLQAMIDAGWIVTGSWPIDTEMVTRLRARDSAALASSVHIVCRPREVDTSQPDHVGDWREVLQQLPQRMHQWLPRLAEEGVVGADAIFACLGPALEIFSRYSRVEKASGETVTLRDYLEHVWAAVSKEALAMVFKGADASGFEEDARLTAMWLWTLSAGQNENGETDDANTDEDEEPNGTPVAAKGYVLEYDAARKIAQGLGAHLESLTSLVEVKGEIARLLPVAERTRRLFGKDEAESRTTTRKKRTSQLQLGFVAELEQAEEAGSWGSKGAPDLGVTVLDRVHQSMILFAAGRGEALRRFLVEEGVGRDQRFWSLAQVLSYLYPKTSDEKRWIDGVLARKKGLGF